MEKIDRHQHPRSSVRTRLAQLFDVQRSFARTSHLAISPPTVAFSGALAQLGSQTVSWSLPRGLEGHVKVDIALRRLHLHLPSHLFSSPRRLRSVAGFDHGSSGGVYGLFICAAFRSHRYSCWLGRDPCDLTHRKQDSIGEECASPDSEPHVSSHACHWMWIDSSPLKRRAPCEQMGARDSC